MLQKRKKEKKKKTEWSKQSERTPDLSLRDCLLKQRKLRVPAIVQEYCIRSLLPPFLSLYRTSNVAGMAVEFQGALSLEHGKKRENATVGEITRA